MTKSSIEHISGSNRAATAKLWALVELMSGYCTFSHYASAPLCLAARRRQRFFLTLDISVVFEPVASISTPCCSTPQALQIPPHPKDFRPRLGVSPHIKNFFADSLTLLQCFFGRIWHGHPRGRPLVVPQIFLKCDEEFYRGD